MINQSTAPYAALLLRVSLGVMFLAHSVYLKAFVFTLLSTVYVSLAMGHAHHDEDHGHADGHADGHAPAHGHAH